MFFFQSAVYQSTSQYPFFLWEDLEADTHYSFEVSACNGFTRQCGSASRRVEATTEDGLSSRPQNVRINCQMIKNNKIGYVDVSWEAPARANGQIEFYNVSGLILSLQKYSFLN